MKAIGQQLKQIWGSGIHPTPHQNIRYLSTKEPVKFRHLSPEARAERIFNDTGINVQCAPTLPKLNKLTEHVVAPFSSMGLSVIRGARIGGVMYENIPAATEEPSVIAAIEKAKNECNKNGGVQVTADPTGTITGQVPFMMHEQIDLNAIKQWARLGVENAQKLPKMARLKERGGGFLGEPRIVQLSERMGVIEMDMDAQDAMGANLINLAMETVASILREHGEDPLMAILTNDASKRVSRARVELDTNSIPGGLEQARRIVQCSEFARISEQRAVTANKGADNGIMAVALATGQDTRAISAALHFFARNLGHDGHYGPICQWKINDQNQLVGELQVPTPVGVVGRLPNTNPTIQNNLALLGRPSAKTLGEIMAAVGLYSAYAAISALSGEGIIRGHMKLHNQAEAKSRSHTDS